MKPITLRLRLFAASLTSIFIALFFAGFGIIALFSNHVETNLTKDLTAQFDRLVALIDENTTPLILKAPLADPSFTTPYGGLYWQITDINTLERIRSRSMWDYEFSLDDPKVLDTKLNKTSLIDPEGTPAIALVQRLKFDLDDGTTRTLDIIMAEDLLVFYEAKAQFRGDISLSLLILGLALSVAAWVQISLGLAPLSKIKKEVNHIRSGKIQRLSEEHAPEVMPLVEEVNSLLDTTDKYMEFARSRASNLAHGLKTALSVMSSEAQNIKQSGNVKSAKMVEQTTNDMQAIIDHQLRLSRLKTRSRSQHFKTSLLFNLNRIIKTLKLTPKGGKVKWHLDIDRSLTLDIDAPDLLELLGIALENATYWSKGNIFISAKIRDKSVHIFIEDDGVGVSPAKIKQLGQRGLRLDSKGSGTGIGLSIASEIVEMNRGKIHFANSKKNGLKLEILLPFSV